VGVDRGGSHWNFPGNHTWDVVVRRSLPLPGLAGRWAPGPVTSVSRNCALEPVEVGSRPVLGVGGSVASFSLVPSGVAVGVDPSFDGLFSCPRLRSPRSVVAVLDPSSVGLFSFPALRQRSPRTLSGLCSLSSFFAYGDQSWRISLDGGVFRNWAH